MTLHRTLSVLVLSAAAALGACQPRDGAQAPVATPSSPPPAATPAVEAPAAGNRPQVDASSPWDAARARNIAFRAVGNEPGWLVEVGHGETPPLHAELDYGSRRIDIAQAQPRKDGLGFTGQTASGTKVELVIERVRCVDDMSGAPFDASAQLSAGGKTYRGCGAFLDR